MWRQRLRRRHRCEHMCPSRWVPKLWRSLALRPSCVHERLLRHVNRRSSLRVLAELCREGHRLEPCMLRVLLLHIEVLLLWLWRLLCLTKAGSFNMMRHVAYHRTSSCATMPIACTEINMRVVIGLVLLSRCRVLENDICLISLAMIRLYRHTLGVPL